MTSQGEGNIIRGSTRSAMDATELAYAQQIYLYNDSVIAGGTVPPLLIKMFDVADKLNDEVCNIINLLFIICLSSLSLASGVLCYKMFC